MPLPFDFYLKKYNLLIEFDGEQHFKPLTRFGGNKKFKQALKRDIIKNDYAFKEEINLLRIPYEELNNINNILKKTFIILGTGNRIDINYDYKIIERYKKSDIFGEKKHS